MTGFGQLVVVNLRLFVQEPITAFFTLAFPIMLVLIFGAMYGNEPTALFGGYGSMDVSMPGYTSLILGSVGLLTVAINTSAYREAGILRRYRASPLRPATYLAADVAANLVMTLVGMAGMLVVAWLIYRVRFEGDPVSVLLAVTLAGLAMYSIGYLIASLARSARMAQVVGMAMLYPMMFLSGAAMPPELLPDSIRRASDLLPLSYVVRLLRGLWFGDPWTAHLLEIAVLVAILAVCAALAARVFRWE